jgi:hypothetical protein
MKPEEKNEHTSYRFSFYPVDDSGIVAADSLFTFSLTSPTRCERKSILQVVSCRNSSSLLVLQDEPESGESSEELNEQEVVMWDRGMSDKRKVLQFSGPQVLHCSDLHPKRQRFSTPIDVFQNVVDKASVKTDGNANHHFQMKETGIVISPQKSVSTITPKPPQR